MNSSSSGGGGEDSPRENECIEYEGDSETPERSLYPDVEVFGDKNEDINIPIQKVKINGRIFDIGVDTLNEVVERAEVTRNPEAEFYNPVKDENGENDGIFWYGGGYSANGSSEGTQAFIEVFDYKDIAVDLDTIDPLDNTKNWYIRSVYSSLETTKDDWAVEYRCGSKNGIKVGMTREEIEKSFGGRKGGTSKGYTYYANTYAALFINYNDKDIATEMYLFADYDWAKIQYNK